MMHKTWTPEMKMRKQQMQGFLRGAIKFGLLSQHLLGAWWTLLPRMVWLWCLQNLTEWNEFQEQFSLEHKTFVASQLEPLREQVMDV